MLLPQGHPPPAAHQCARERRGSRPDYLLSFMDENMEAWVEYWAAESRAYHERLAIITEAFDTATAHESDCDVCAHILTLIPRDIPEFQAAFDRAGPVLDHELIEVGGIWAFPRRDFLWHESHHSA
jgi:hypothetical protein